MKKNIKHIVYLGAVGFPIGFAEIEKVKLVSRSLINAGASVLVISNKGVHKRNKGLEVYKSGTEEEIKYIYTTGTPFRPEGFLKRNLLKVYGIVAEIALLFKLAIKKQLDIAIISSKRFNIIFLYYLLSRLLRFKTVLNYAEFNSELSKEKGNKNGINDFLFEKYAVHLMDGIIPISEFLVDVLKKKSPTKPYIKIPVLCDFSKFDPGNRQAVEPYFLFCSSVNNMEVMDFILEAFGRINVNAEHYLYLVVNGPDHALALFSEAVAQHKKSRFIKTFRNLPYQELVTLYINARGLLIPLRPVPRDIARFPHKIGEYCASANPIITTNVGEVVNFFEDNKNAFVAADFAVDDFSQKMEEVLNHPEKAKVVGQSGLELGYKHFNYLHYGDQLMDFFKKL
ncbi:glycosyltransferase [Fulvivirgaceae bacterium BMA12]|uniref:Glycosyltransferase n=1 Tax=Agaribacillus aureus TaxID=3051825 RepID=A0ABT8LBP6_9BACT|nr:glycosyltransferase [Fulvivirgaceae bacterium BMA12]